MSSKKFDEGKPRMDLLPGSALKEVAKVLANGAAKYGDHNWRLGMKHSRLIGAALRHLHAHNDGQDIDAESGLPHLAHAACCLLFLTAYNAEGLGEDDRYKKESQPAVSARNTTSMGGGGVGRVTYTTYEDYIRLIDHHNGFTYQPDLAGASSESKKTDLPKSGAQ